MKKKKLVLALTVAAITATALIGGTLAWFTASGNVVNTISTGTVALEVTEPNYIGDSDAVNIVPGDVIKKDPTITYTGSADAKLRYKINISLTDADNNEVTGDLLSQAQKELILQTVTTTTGAAIVTDIDRSTLVNDTWYYTTVKQGQEIVLFDQVKIPTTWGNDFQGMHIVITVNAEAVQDSAITDENNNDAGWTAADINIVTGKLNK